MFKLPRAIVDSHHHLWDLQQKINYSWLCDEYDASKFFLGEYRGFCMDYFPENFRASWGGMPVIASVHVEAECDRQFAQDETTWLHQQSINTGLPNAIVAYVNLLEPDADDHLVQQSSCPLVKSIRFKPTTSQRANESVLNHPGSLQDKRWDKGLALLSRHGLAWDLRIPFWHLEEAAMLLKGHQHLPVALEHTGMPWDRSKEGLAVWRKGMEALANLSNVHVKLSEICLKDRPWLVEDNLPVIREAISIFGWQRCMFGSNYPVTGLRISYPALISAMSESFAHLDEAARDAIWCHNAMKFYQITV